MEKQRIWNISAVAVIVSPDEDKVFLSRKDDGYPIALIRGGLCPIGGNWTGKDAARDTGPRDTVRREIREELTLRRPVRSGAELGQLGFGGQVTYEPTASNGAEIRDADEQLLQRLAATISEVLSFETSYIHTVTAEAMRTADPSSTRETIETLCFVYRAQLHHDEWATLETLQERYGNLSNEAPTLILGRDQLGGEKYAFGHESSVRAVMGVNTSIIPGVYSERRGEMRDAPYAELLDRYDPIKRPVI